MSSNITNDTTCCKESIPQKSSLQRFTLFPELPQEIRRQVWRETLPGPRVIEVEWSTTLGTWQICLESKPSTPQLHAVNGESRDELLRIYKPMLPSTRACLVLGQHPSTRAILAPGQHPSSFGCFINFSKDTVYLVSGSDNDSPFPNIISYTNSIVAQLHPEFLIKVQFLAIQAESFSAPEWDLGPPYNPSSPRVQRCRLNLTNFLSWMPALKSVSMVVGDDYGPQEWLGQEKREGLVTLTELKVGYRQTMNGVKSWFDAWYQVLGADLSLKLRSNILVQQASRNGLLSFIDVWNCLTDNEIDFLSMPVLSQQQEDFIQ